MHLFASTKREFSVFLMRAASKSLWFPCSNNHPCFFRCGYNCLEPRKKRTKEGSRCCETFADLTQQLSIYSAHTHTHTHQPFVVTCAVCTASANAHPTPLSVDSRFKKIIICYRRQAFCLLVFCVAPAAYVCSGKKVCAKINCSFSSRLRVLKALGSKKSRCVLKQRAATD